MAISAGAIWRVRIGGSNTLCSGLFDPTIAGAGTDYTEQDTAQLALTDLASSTPYTTITSATGGFTAAMIGNGIYVASGTGFTAGRYVITAVTNTNTAVVDRACAASAASAGVAKVGGALAHFNAVTAAAPYTAAAGNVVYVRGQGSNDPIDIDYNMTNFTAVGGAAYIGYNGRPKIGHNCYGMNLGGRCRVENFYFVATSASFTNYGAVYGGAYALAHNCVFDTSGWDASHAAGISLSRCSFVNTGVQSAGTYATYYSSPTNYNIAIANCLFKDQRSSAVSLAMIGIVTGCIFQNNGVDGLVLSGASAGTSGAWVITGNTFYSNAGHGINLAIGNAAITNNIFANHTGSGKYGLNVADGVNNASHLYSESSLGNNCFYGNTTNSNIPLPASTLTVDPQFANAPVDLTPTNSALRVIGGVGAL